MNLSDILGITGIIIGIVVSYYFYRVSKRAKEPSWSIRSNNLIEGYGSKLSDLEIRYKSQQVENLTISRVLFWNEGSETIDRNDIVAANPLRIEGLNNTRLIDTKVLSSNNPSSRFLCSLSDDKTHASLEFDYLDQDNGAVIQIFHTGTSSQDISVKGDIKGVKVLRQKDVEVTELPFPLVVFFRKNIKHDMKRRIMIVGYLVVTLFFLSCGALFILFTLLPRASDLSSAGLNYFTNIVLNYLNGVVFAVLGVFYLWRSIQKWRSASPKGLESFEEEIEV